MPPHHSERFTAQQLSERLGISRQLIGYWHARGKLARDAAKRYRYGDVLQVEKAMREHKQSHRKQLAAA